jgi:hypothetical protein
MYQNIRSMVVFLGINMLTNCSVVSDQETLGEYVDDTGITAKVKQLFSMIPCWCPFKFT